MCSLCCTSLTLYARIQENTPACPSPVPACPSPAPHLPACLQEIAAGMSFLHDTSYVHGDLRSPNVFVGDGGKVKIGDFGFTKLMGRVGEGRRAG